MNRTVETTEVEMPFDDVNFEAHTSTGGGDWETVPTDSYDLELISFREEKKTDNKMQRDLAMKQKTKPDTAMEDIDQYQWVWLFRIVGGEYDGIEVKEWTSRSFHENSKAGKIAAAAVGIDKYDVNVLRTFGGTRALMHKRLRGYVEEVTGTDGKQRNYIKIYSKMPERRPRPQATRNQTGVAAVPKVQLQGYPTDDGDIEF